MYVLVLPDSRAEGSAMRTIADTDPLDPWGPPREEQPDTPQHVREGWQQDLADMGLTRDALIEWARR